jgi:hypothetical protein
LKYASLDLFGDDTKASGASTFAAFGFVEPPRPWLKRLSGAIAFDPLSSVLDDTGMRQSGAGDLGLRAGFVLVPANDTTGRPRLDIQYGIKIPTASSEKGLGSGHVDHKLTIALDKAWASGVWANAAFATRFKGNGPETPRTTIASLIGNVELPLGGKVAYQGFLQLDTATGDIDLSTFQQHGGVVKLGKSVVWIGGGLSLGRDAGQWTPGWYLRLEWRP